MASIFGLALLRLCALVSKLPIEARSRLGYRLGWFFSLLPTRDRRIAALQLEKTLGPGASRYVGRSYGNLGRNVLESLDLGPLLETSTDHSTLPSLFREENPARISHYLASQKPIVCLTAHFGNWDLLAALMVRRGFVLHVIGREARNPHLQALLKSIRDKTGVNTLWRAEGPKGVKEIMSALKARHVVAALIDQDTRVAGEMVPFFGIPAHTPHTLIELAKRLDALIVGAVLLRDKRGLGGTIIVEEFDRTRSSVEILAQYHAFLERVIREDPGQWVWLHKRWRTGSNGERMSSKDYLRYLEAR